VSNEPLDELAEAARNRGLKLVRSRVRTPAKRRFGRVGLADKSGKPVFGMDSKGPIARPEEVEQFLRNLTAGDWGASLDVPVRPRRRKGKKTLREPANDREPARQPAPRAPKAPPKPEVRAARPSDSPRLAELICSLGHEIDGKQVRKNLAALKKSGQTPLVATLDKNVVGLCGVERRVAIGRPAPLGRISSLVVAREAQGRGIGRMLVEAAEAWMRGNGCTIAEVTSNDRRAEAHAFYRHMGFERTSIRFAKTLS
jgi:GNAT superfamily N-acetyltransferase